MKGSLDYPIFTRKVENIDVMLNPHIRKARVGKNKKQAIHMKNTIPFQGQLSKLPVQIEIFSWEKGMYIY